MRRTSSPTKREPLSAEHERLVSRVLALGAGMERAQADLAERVRGLKDDEHATHAKSKARRARAK